ncbi:hypothetical protein H0H81_005397 [Sphagnurus paluster]|uniref:Acyl-CoA dehydrogenase/oxidase C-terminal domain-containing protein n=1 Tax=Sphagnurus paluster TaxID=117069 RepID=A0A9P7GKL2_9AGAR|nr:hypothetical protein H0H81_005397 [Sphagnurus paluster]
MQSYKQQAAKLAGPIGLLKMHATRTAQETATDAVQIFGGRGITKTGMGQYIEHVGIFSSPPSDIQLTSFNMIKVPSHCSVRRDLGRR